MPCNLYGPGDNYNLSTSHFLPALIRKIYESKIKKKNYIYLWGTGKPKRELLFVDDLADAIIFFLGKKTKYNLINIGSNTEKTILEYAKLIIKYFGLNVKIKFKKNKPDGTYRKKLDLSKSKKLKWHPKTRFQKGLDITIKEFLKNYKLISQN